MAKFLKIVSLIGSIVTLAYLAAFMTAHPEAELSPYAIATEILVCYGSLVWLGVSIWLLSWEEW